MRKFLTIGLITAGLIVGSVSAEAGHRHHKYYNGHGGYHHGYYGDIGDEILIGAGIIGGAILLGGLLSRPSYARPPAYYAPPRHRYCERERVYRYLPDGRIQWGIRTTCY
jgi:hypothetical protein